MPEKNKDKPKKKTGRPRKELDQKTFEGLCRIQCTRLEMCEFFGINDVTLDSWCKRTYGERFSVVFSKKRVAGAISLRHAGFQMAQTNPAVWIFHAKNFLGMVDKAESQESAQPLPLTNYRNATN